MLKIFEVSVSRNGESSLEFNDELLQVISEEELLNLVDEETNQKLTDVIVSIVESIQQKI